MKYFLVFLIVGFLFLLVTVLVLKATYVELGEGWYLVPDPSTHA